MTISKPKEGSYHHYYDPYINLVNTNFLEAELKTNLHEMSLLLVNCDESKWNFRYQEGKWSVAEVLMHIADTEQMFCYRILNLVRGLNHEFVGFDHDLMAKNAVNTKLTAKRFLELYESGRKYTLAMARSLESKDWDKAGVVDGKPFTVRSLFYTIIGHERHHMNVLFEKYLKA